MFIYILAHSSVFKKNEMSSDKNEYTELRFPSQYELQSIY